MTLLRVFSALFLGISMTLDIALASDVVVIHAGQLLTAPGDTQPLQERTLTIRDGRIESIEKGYTDPDSMSLSNDDVLSFYDLKTFTVLPGLIDSHVHLTMEGNPAQRLQRVELSKADRAVWAAGNAKKTLLAGFTTVRDVGSPGEAIFAVRDGVRRGHIDGPRIFASGPAISVTGGHGDGTQGYTNDVADVLHSSGVCDGVAECRKAVREQVRQGADHIKIMATAGVLSNTAAGLEQQFFEDELNSIVEAAHSMGRKVTAHAHGVNGINAALSAGVDSIEHGTYLNDESMRLFKANDAYLVPTVLAGVTVTEWANDENTFLTPVSQAKAKIIGPLMLNMARRAHENGVKIAYGTDTGVSAHGDNALEFALLVEAGMSPAEAIRSATIVASEHLGQQDVLGTLEPGKFADIIATDGDPLSDVRELEDVDFVMKAGVVYKQP